MIFLYITLSIFAIILVTLFLPVNVIFIYKDNLSIIIRFLWINYDITDKNKMGKKQKRETVPDLKVEKPNIAKTINKDGLKGFISLVSRLTRLGVSVLNKILKRTTIKELTIDIKVCGTDAFSTAIKYGNICSIVYTFSAIITAKNPPNIYNINISPEFDGINSSIDFKLHIYARLFYILYALVVFIKRYSEIKEI